MKAGCFLQQQTFETLKATAKNVDVLLCEYSKISDDVTMIREKLIIHVGKKLSPEQRKHDSTIDKYANEINETLLEDIFQGNIGMSREKLLEICRDILALNSNSIIARFKV